MAVLIQITKSANVAFKYCRECGGVCCRSLPGATEPLQWGKTKPTRIARLTNALASGRFIIDHLPIDYSSDNEVKIEDTDRAFYVRPATTEEEKSGSIQPNEPLRFSGERGPCCFLTDRGCSMLAKDRPTECRDLVPHQDHRSCKNKKIREEYVVQWIPFQSEIAAACKLAELRRKKAA